MMGAAAHADLTAEDEQGRIDNSQYSLGVSKQALGRTPSTGKQLMRAGLASYMVSVGAAHGTKTCFDWIADRLCVEFVD